MAQAQLTTKTYCCTLQTSSTQRHFEVKRSNKASIYVDNDHPQRTIQFSDHSPKVGGSKVYPWVHARQESKKKGYTIHSKIEPQRDSCTSGDEVTCPSPSFDPHTLLVQYSDREKWESFFVPAETSMEGMASPTSSISVIERQHHTKWTSGTADPAAAATHQSCVSHQNDGMQGREDREEAMVGWGERNQTLYQQSQHSLQSGYYVEETVGGQMGCLCYASGEHEMLGHGYFL